MTFRQPMIFPAVVLAVMFSLCSAAEAGTVKGNLYNPDGTLFKNTSDPDYPVIIKLFDDSDVQKHAASGTDTGAYTLTWTSTPAPPAGTKMWVKYYQSGQSTPFFTIELLWQGTSGPLTHTIHVVVP